MHNNGGLKLLFVINPVSGGKEKNDWEAAIRNYFRDSIHIMSFILFKRITIKHQYSIMWTHLNRIE